MIRRRPFARSTRAGRTTARWPTPTGELGRLFEAVAKKSAGYAHGGAVRPRRGVFRARRIRARSVYLRHHAAHPFPDGRARRAGGGAREAAGAHHRPAAHGAGTDGRFTAPQGVQGDQPHAGVRTARQLPAAYSYAESLFPSSTWGGPSCAACARTAGSTSARPGPNCTTWRRTPAKPPT